MSQDIEQLKKLVSQGNPLQLFDLAVQRNRNVEELTAKQQRDCKALIMQALLAVAERDFEGDEEDLEEAALTMLDDYRTIASAKLVGICLLRLIAEPSSKWITNQTWRPKVATFLDSQFADTLYPDWKVDPNAMSHEKLTQISNHFRETEQQLIQTIQALTSLDRIKPHRQKLMQILNQRTGRVVFYPFLVDGFEAQLSEIYTRSLDYQDKSGSLEVLDAYESATDQINSFIGMNESWNTIYSQIFAKDLGQKLLDLIKQDIANNKATQPAMVRVRPRDKKYPFHQVGHEVSLGLMVTNNGPGYAYETKLTCIADDNIELLEDEITLGRLAPGISHPVEIRTKVKSPCEATDLVLEINWQDFDGSREPAEYSFQLEAQRSDIDWDKLARSDPYSLEPVIDEDELIGRKEALNGLLGLMESSRIGSAMIYGQKRVGKTSIAKALESHLRKSNYLVVYLEGGDYVNPNPKLTISSLGRKLCTQLKTLDPRVKHITSPEFEEALSPLTDFLDAVKEIDPNCRIVFILDEFDELPLDLYSRGPLGDSFFLTLRSTSSRPNIGFVLVGGEKMNHIIDSQGDQLNKWKTIPVDYFSRETDWADYKELIQRPVTGSIEYTEDALVALHEITSGNPYFTKLICDYIFRSAIQKRDCYITRDEVYKAVQEAVAKLSANTFQHFWEDGIVETGDLATEKSIRRRKILIATSDILVNDPPATGKKVAESPLVNDVTAPESELREFASRKVLTCNTQNDSYEFKVLLFHNWLKDRGIHEIITTFSDLNTALRKRQEEEAQRIQAAEIVDLVDQFGTYKGQSITEDKVRAWLNQFGTARKQRAMFKVLQNLRFYSNRAIREKMKEVDGIVRRGLTRHLERGKLKRSDIAVSYLDKPGKSGAHFARLYADEASIYVDNVVEQAKLSEFLTQKTDIQALVFVDDFVGTGNSAADYLQAIDQEFGSVIKEHNTKVVFVAVVAYIEGWRHVEEMIETLGIPVLIHVCEILDDTAKCFGEKSIVFSDLDERKFAKEIAMAQGKLLEKKWPLGYGNLELAIVFEHGCPNNSLPILWSESTGQKQWRPLFKRL